MGGPADECTEDGRYGVPDLSHRCLELRRRLHAIYDGGGSDLPGPPDTAHPVHGLRIGLGGRFVGKKPSDATRH